jgi:diacylglycerol kinase family enzyme
VSKIEMIINTASGGVRPGAPDEAAVVLEGLGIDANISAPQPGDLMKDLERAVAAKPDVLVVLAGDGTARAAIEMCGPKGPLVAPLPGGTMNMLPHAVYGERSWQEALALACKLDGGAIDGRKFLVAAILGSPALWAPAREAARQGEGLRALRRARIAFARAFKGRLRYTIDGGDREKAEALVFMCPLTSRGLDDDEQALEAAAMDPAGAMEAFRLGVNAMLGDWRSDPAVNVTRSKIARVWAASGIPALLDGEPVKLGSLAEVTFHPGVGRVLMVPKDI